MVAALIGLVFVIVAVVLWVGDMSTAHALAVLIGLIGVLLVLYWVLPPRAYARRR